MRLELRNHPSQARHPITKAPLFDAAGEPVPLFNDQRGIYLDGALIGYCHATPGYPVGLIVHVDASMRDTIFEFVETAVGRVASVNMPPQTPVDEESETDELYDDSL